MIKKIVNIINFVRGTDLGDNIDLVGTVDNQLTILNKYKLKSTFLFEYDALCNEKMIKLFKSKCLDVEVGLWIELVKGNIEASGEQWRSKGEKDWDPCGNICNTVGYTEDARKKIVDVSMIKFKEVFGQFPTSVGAWSMDCVTLLYLQQKYNIQATCNCKEQWGTDGYTLWGGYYGDAYYPSKYNSICPAQTLKSQINIPMFRMLGSDPIYQYDVGMSIEQGAKAIQPVVTLEPVYTGELGGGGNIDWVDWFFKQNYTEKCLSFAYAQAGQENNFGWERMSKGYIYQMEKIKQLSDSNQIDVMTLSESGKWFKKNFKYSPPVSIIAEEDWKNQGHKSYWYCCKNYRSNLYFEGDNFWIRDLYLFDQNYKERYLYSTLKTYGYIYDNLPVIDGNRFSGNGIRAGIYLKDIKSLEVIKIDSDIKYTKGKDSISVKIKTEKFGTINVIYQMSQIRIDIEKNYNQLFLMFEYDMSSDTIYENIRNNIIYLKYNDYNYALPILEGKVNKYDDKLVIYTNQKGKIIIKTKK